MRVFVIGHVSPDLDAIASAVVYAEFLKKTDRYEGAEVIPLRAGEPNKETAYIFRKFEVKMPKPIEEFTISPEDKFVLVDHNEGRQRHDSVPEGQVVEVSDHHKLNMNFSSPIRVDMKPFGSTCTLTYDHFGVYDVRPSKKAESLILAAILSDTQGLKSSTTTGYDSEIAHEIAFNHELDIEELTYEIFSAKSDLKGLKPIEIVKKDFKVYDFGGTQVFINQIEVVETGKVLENKNALIKALEQAKKEEKAKLGYIVVTDILRVNSQILYTNDTEKKILEKAFLTKGHDNVADIGPKLSRKKDIAPAIEKVL